MDISRLVKGPSVSKSMIHLNISPIFRAYTVSTDIIHLIQIGQRTFQTFYGYFPSAEKIWIYSLGRKNIGAQVVGWEIF